MIRSGRVDDTITHTDPAAVPSVQFLHRYYETAENSGKTAGHLAVFPNAEPPAGQDFRGEMRYRPLIICRKTAKTAGTAARATILCIL